MTVSELIEKLKEMDQTAIVVTTMSVGYAATDVEVAGTDVEVIEGYYVNDGNDVPEFVTDEDLADQIREETPDGVFLAICIG